MLLTWEWIMRSFRVIILLPTPYLYFNLNSDGVSWDSVKLLLFQVHLICQQIWQQFTDGYVKWKLQSDIFIW